MDELITLQFDGGSRGNPGPAGVGVVLLAADGTPVVTLGRFIGRATNNAAEYQALILALQEAKRLGAKKILVRGDSELIIKQMTGVYRVKNLDLRPLYDRAKSLFREFPSARIEHKRREHNTLADKLANLAMDRKGDVTEVADKGDGRGSPAAAAPLDVLDTPSPVSPEPGDHFACARCGCVIELRQPSTIRPHQLKPFACQCGNPMQEG